jgi:magnesium chelatase subunit D
VTAEARFPFSAVVGQDEAKLALQLAAVEPRLGGVLLRGEKGSAKTTLARGLAGLLAPGAPFVDLPLGATEDRVVGTLDLGAALTGGEVRLRPGLLAQVDGGVLYVDEVNLLADHLVDTLLDVAVSGVNVVERDSLSERHPARFVLIGSMNPEEGELRPQLLDRFGLCVDVRAPAEAADRVAAVRRRLDHDASGPPAGEGRHPDDAALAERLRRAAPAAIGDELIGAAARLALAVGAEGLRADLALCRAAAALAGLDGRGEATEADLRVVAPLVLAHRARRSPFDPPTLPPEALDDALDEVLADPPPEETPEPPEASPPPAGGVGGAPRALPVGAERRPPRLERPAMVRGARGRAVTDVALADAPGHPVAVAATVRDVARHPADPPERHLRARVGEVRAERLLVLAVDLSGSMGAPERAAAATGTVLGLLSRAYQQRDRVALVGFRAGGAEVLLRPTASVEVARNRLGALETGGDTPLGAGLRTALDVATTPGGGPSGDVRPLIAVLTDGRATGDGALDEALAAAAAIARSPADAVVLDCESGRARLGLAGRVAAAMNAECVPVDGLEPVAITGVLLARGGAR